MFEGLVAEFPEETEAYWGLCLCKYGIEYVDDTGSRTQDSVLAQDIYNELTEKGYKVEKVQCVDMFPRTYHVETICLLTKLNTK